MLDCNAKWLKNGKLRKAILSAFYNISQRSFGILLILWCSFKLWWNFCPGLSSSKGNMLPPCRPRTVWAMGAVAPVAPAPLGMRVEKTLTQTLASQLSCNSCSRLTGAWELRKLTHKLSLLNSHQLSCNSCSRLNGSWELRKLSLDKPSYSLHQVLKIRPHISSCDPCGNLVMGIDYCCTYNLSWEENCVPATCLIVLATHVTCRWEKMDQTRALFHCPTGINVVPCDVVRAINGRRFQLLTKFDQDKKNGIQHHS
jgi:hypothetical protein